MQQKNHFTTRRGFIAASGFGGISLYGLWAAYGAAPSPLALLGLEHPQDPTSSNGGGHWNTVPLQHLRPRRRALEGTEAMVPPLKGILWKSSAA